MHDEPMKPAVHVVDDEAAIVEVITDFIHAARLPVHVVPSFSAREALTKISAMTPSVVISDVKMPEMTGLEMLKELNVRGIFVPVIFLSGFGVKDVIAEAWRLGAFDFLDKPVDPKRVVETIKIALELGQSFSRSRSAGRGRTPTTLELRLTAELNDKIRKIAAEEHMGTEEWCLRALERLAG